MGPDGNIWTIDVQGHSLFSFNPQGRLALVIGNPGGSPGTMETTDSFNRPTGVAFGPGGEFYGSDGYVNSRVVN